LAIDIGCKIKCIQDAIPVYEARRLNGKIDDTPANAMKNSLLSTIPLIPDDFPPEEMY